MEKSELRSYVETSHKNYLKLANESLAELDTLSDNEITLKEFHLKKATEYVNKADAVMRVLDFINKQK